MFSFRFKGRSAAKAAAGERGRPLGQGLRVGLPAALLGAGAAVAAVLFLVDHSEGSRGLPDRWQRGMNLTAFLPDAYSEPATRRAMLTARAAGTERVALVPTWYMETATSSEIFRDPEKTPTDESLRAAAATARELGLSVTLKPHVDVRDGSFRGEILPGDPERWFESYAGMLLEYARLAAEIEAAALIVGTELTSMSLEPEPWRELIAAAREVYEGPLSFAANWVDGAESVEFWDELDFIGIDAYMPLLTRDREPTVGELVEAWAPHEVRMRALSERWELPVLFTELGYESRLGTAARIDAGAAPVDERAQANAYEAAFRALRRDRWFAGIWWWEWSAEGKPPAAGGFSPEGKLAEDVLGEWQPEAATGSGRSGGSGSR